MTAGAFLLRLPNPATCPARNLRGGYDSYIVWANSGADAAAFVAAMSDSAVWENGSLVTPTALAAATNMSGWALRIRLYNAASPPVEVANIQVQATGASEGTVAATGVLTSSDQYIDGDTVTIGTRVYTLQGTLTGGDGHVHIGASEAATITNLTNAINNSGGTPGTDYNVTAADPNVTAVAASHTCTVTAKVLGTGGNSIATTNTESDADAAWGGATLSGGVNTTDQVSSLAELMVTALNSAGIGITGASFDPASHTLTVAAPGDNIGNYTFDVAFFPPARGTTYAGQQFDDQSPDYFQPGSNFAEGVDVVESYAVPGFVVSTDQGGASGDDLSVVFVADSFAIPTLLLAAKSQE